MKGVIFKVKYYKNQNFAKSVGTTGFVTIVACGLIAVGAVGWFALSRNNGINEAPSDNFSSNSSYPDDDFSYNDVSSVPDIVESDDAADVDESVEDVPYEEEKPTSPTPEKPTYVMPVKGDISKSYSDCELQHSETYGDMRLHTGIDILCKSGSNIKAAGGGIVKSVSDDALYGRIITIENSDGITIKYCGMASVNVNEDDTVATGDIIGTSGEVPSECADKPHIHIEVLVDGKIASPLATLGLE